MHISLVRSFVLFVVVFIAVAFESGCVGVTGGCKARRCCDRSGSVSIAINPTNASIQVGGTQQFSATVTGATDPSVTWSATGGTVSSDGLYTAPSAIGTYAVTATSVADSTKSATATVSVTSGSPAVSIAVNPGSASLQAGATQQFTAAVSGTSNTAVTWSASGGTISASGLYTAPAAAGTYSVIATSVADSTVSGAATVTVTAATATISVAINPPSAALQTGKYAAVQRNGYRGQRNTAVTWSASRGINLECRPLYGAYHRRHLHGESNQCR